MPPRKSRAGVIGGLVSLVVPSPRPPGMPGADLTGAQHQGMPPRKSRAGVIAGLVLLAVVLVTLAAFLPLALAPKVLDRSAVQRDLATKFQAREGVAIDVICPNDMRLTQGAVYTCTGSTARGENVRVRIRIADANTAVYTWQVG